MQLKRLIGYGALVAILLLTFFATTDATNYTPTGTRVTVGGVSCMQYSHTFVNGNTDVVLIPFRWSTSVRGSNPVGQIFVGTCSVNGDSVDIAVRYTVSPDNTSWQTFVIGTDSTTWATAVTTGYAVSAIEIDQATHGGWFPYSRVAIYGSADNLAGTKVRVWVIDNPNR